MMACWSPPEFAPPSIGVLGPSGYGPLSLSLAYWNVTVTSGCLPVTTVNGMP